MTVLREFGHDVLTSFEAGNANKGMPDEVVFAYAQQESRIILTLNRKDFIKLHADNPFHFGIMVCTEDKDFKGLAQRIHNEIENRAGKIENQLIKVYRPVK